MEDREFGVRSGEKCKTIGEALLSQCEQKFYAAPERLVIGIPKMNFLKPSGCLSHISDAAFEREEMELGLGQGASQEF
jgi:hypothetical protein